MKFGGASLDTTAALTQVLSIVLTECENWDRVVLVASALEGVTDSLIEATHLARLDNRRGYRRIITTIRTRHLALAEQLPLGQIERDGLLADIDKLLFNTLDVCQSLSAKPTDITAPDVIDAIVAVGERLAARIVAALLRQNNVRGVAFDATDLIITDDVHGNANPNLPLTQERVNNSLIPMLDRNIIPVITGFLGATATGKLTTLGRSGSDLTASILATCMDADEVWIWSGVDGLMSGDPLEILDTRTIPLMTYDEVAEMAYFGARILHARMIPLLRERNIPLRIKNVFKPQMEGTLVQTLSRQHTQSIKAVTSIAGIGLMASHSGPLATIAKQIDQTIFEASGTHADVMISSQSSSHSFICLVIPTSARPDAVQNAQKALKKVLQEEPAETSPWEVLSVTIITAIGSHLDTRPDLTANVLQTLQDIRILALSLGPTGNNLSIMVKSEDGERTLHQIHQFILNNG